MRNLAVAALSGFALLTAHAAHADVIYSDSSAGYSTANPYSTPVAVEFTATETATLQGIDLFLVSLGGSASFDNETVSLLSDVNNIPTTVLGSWGGSSGGYVSYNQPYEEKLTGLSGVTLTQGTTYFLQVGSSTPLAGVAWLRNGAGVQTAGYYANGAWVPGTIANADFDIIGTAVTPVPEPGTLALLGAGLLCIGAFLRRRGTSAPAA